MEPGRHNSDSGFSLIELLVTLAMIAVLVVVTLPPVFNAARDREVRNAAQEVVNIFEFARVQAANRNRAYQIIPTVTTGQHTNQVAGNGHVQGQFVVHEGPTSACVNFGAGVQNVRLFEIGWEYPSVHLVSTDPTDIPQATLCVKPDGRLLEVDTGMPIQSAEANYAAGDARFVLQRFQGDNQPVGPQNVVIVSFNGAARITTQ